MYIDSGHIRNITELNNLPSDNRYSVMEMNNKIIRESIVTLNLDDYKMAFLETERVGDCGTRKRISYSKN